MTIPNPSAIVTFVLCYAELIIPLVNRLLYERLLSREQQHELVLLDKHIDFASLEAACADFRADSGLGTPAKHPVSRLCRLLLLHGYYGGSFRESANNVRYHWLWRWFCGYALWEETPSHSTLQRFHNWVRDNHPTLFFDTINNQIRADCPEEAEEPLIGDSFAMHANAARESRLRRLRHTVEQIERELDELTGSRAQAAKGCLEAERTAIFGEADEPSEYWLPDWRNTTCITAAAATRLLATLRGLFSNVLAPLALERRLDQLDKILQDEFHLIEDEAGIVQMATLRAKEERGSYAIGSATDPEATFRVHGDKPAVLGYNVSIFANVNFIWGISAQTGAQPDNVAIVPMLEQLQTSSGNFPPKLIYDQAAGTGKTMADVATASEGQTQLVARLVDYSARSERFGPADFTLSEDELSLSCPNGEESTVRYRAGKHTEGWQFRFSADQCSDCPLWTQCRAPNANPEGFRTVSISDHRSEVEAARAYQASDEFGEDMKLRPQVERTIACVVRYYNGRYATGRGLAAADFQAKGAAIAYNLRAWLRLIRQRDPPAVVHG